MSRRQNGTDVAAPGEAHFPFSAEACKIVPNEPLAAIRDLATLAIAPMDNAPRDGMLRLRGIAKFGSAADTMGSDTWYKIKVATCRLDFSYLNAECDPFHSYAKSAAKTQMTLTEDTQTDAEKINGMHLNFGLDSAVKAGNVGSKFSAAFNSIVRAGSKQRTANHIKFHQELFVIQDTPTGVRIGHEIYGDPNKPDQLLEGAYLNERPDIPLSIVFLKKSPAKIHAALRVTLGDLRVVDQRTGRRVTPSSSYQDDVARILKERVAGMRVQKELQKQPSDLPGYEIASHSIEVIEQLDDEPI